MDRRPQLEFKQKQRLSLKKIVALSALFLLVISAGIIVTIQLAGTGESKAGNAPENDDSENAIVLSDIDNWTSTNKAYTTINATPDGASPSCYNSGPYTNVWFKFQATTSEIYLELKLGGNEGTIRYPYITLWDSSGNEIACCSYYSSDGDLEIGAASLTQGDWYFISVDNRNNVNYRGSFSFYIDDRANYNFKEGAYELTDISDWTSDDAAFSTINATAQGGSGCGHGGEAFSNRWFKFHATTESITAQVRIGGDEGSLRYPYISIWDSSGNLLNCAEYYSSDYDLEVGAVGLIPGDLYYICVDNRNNAGYRGTFTLHVDDQPSYDFKEGAIELNDLDDWTSDLAAYNTIRATASDGESGCGHGGEAFSNRWFKFHATTEGITAEVRIGGDEGSLRYPYISIWDSLGNLLNCAGYYSSDYDLEVSAVGLAPGELYYISVDNRNNSGYQGTFTLHVDDQPSYDFKEGAIELTSLDDWTSQLAAYNTIRATASDGESGCGHGGEAFSNRWFKFHATTESITAEVRIGGSEGTLRYPYISVWDSSGNLLNCAGYYSSDYDLEVSAVGLTHGNLYYISVDNRNNSGYQGTFTLHVDDQPNYDFKEGAIELNDLDDWTSELAAYNTIRATASEGESGCGHGGEAFSNRWFKFKAINKEVTINLLIGDEKGTLRYPYLALWDSSGSLLDCQSYTSSTSDLTIAYDSLSVDDWYYVSVDNRNNSDYQGTFTFGIDNGSSSPLPIELAEFNVAYNNGEVKLNWATASEINNSHFEIQRSIDGQNFQNIGRVEGIGNSLQRNDYHFTDFNPPSSKAIYYRLRQVDFDGKFEFTPIKVVNIEDNNNIKFGIINIRPNPFSSSFVLEMNCSQSIQVTLSIFTIQGTIVHQESLRLYPGTNEYTFREGAKFKNGNYLLRLSGTGVQETRKITKYGQ